MADDKHGRSDSYRVATVTTLQDDNKTADGKTKARRKMTKKEGNLDDLKQELDIDHHKIPLDELLQRWAIFFFFFLFDMKGFCRF